MPLRALDGPLTPSLAEPRFRGVGSNPLSQRRQAGTAAARHSKSRPRSETGLAGRPPVSAKQSQRKTAVASSRGSGQMQPESRRAPIRLLSVRCRIKFEQLCCTRLTDGMSYETMGMNCSPHNASEDNFDLRMRKGMRR